MPFLCHGLEKSLSEGHGHRTAGEQHGHGMVCVNQTQFHCGNLNLQRHSMAETLHGHGMVCVKGLLFLEDYVSVKASHRLP